MATGLRRGEVAGLRWTDVDLTNSRLAIRSTRVLVYSDVQVVEPKIRRSRRSVSLDAGTVAALHARRARQEAERRYAGRVWTETGNVFVRDDGRPARAFTRRSYRNASATRRSRSPSTTAATCSPRCRNTPPRRWARSLTLTRQTLNDHLNANLNGRGGASESVPAAGSSSRRVRRTRFSEASPNLRGATLPAKLTFTVPEAAALLGICRTTAYECVRRGEIPSLTLGRRILITRAQLEQLLGPLPLATTSSTTAAAS